MNKLEMNWDNFIYNLIPLKFLQNITHLQTSWLGGGIW